MEEGQEGPAIIFNQIDDIKFEPNKRAMFLHKPFSNVTTVLNIQNRERRGIEKNWAPLFLKQRSSSAQGSSSKFMWFVYNYEPLQILKCQISSGHCKFVYQQQNIGMPWELHKLGRLYGDTYGSIRGGTDYIPISKSSGHGLQSFIAFPRSHTQIGCKDVLYRPFLSILTTDGKSWWLDYISEGLEFGHTILDKEQYNNICEKGRILIVNSLTKFDEIEDTMTVLFSVADTTVQVAQVRGIMKLINNLPHFQEHRWHDKIQDSNGWQQNGTYDISVCGLISVAQYALRWCNVTDRS